MSRNFNIGISGKIWCDWSGGIDLIRVIISALLLKGTHKDKKVQIFVFLPQRTTGFIALLKDILKMRKIRFFQELRINRNKKRSLDAEWGLSVKYVLYEDTTSCWWDISCQDLVAKLQKYKIDIVLPMCVSFGKKFSIPWIGYLADFNCYHHPERFDERERIKMIRVFSEVFDDSIAILVNGKFIEQESKGFFPGSKAQIFCMPPAPFAREEWLIDGPWIDVKNRYNIPDKYFLISNHFYAHDMHITAFKAFSFMIKSMAEYNDVYLVCTGNTNIEPDYFRQLMKEAKNLGITSKLIILGFIPKFDQIQIMKNCVAVVQPTLSEGGPGGGCIYDAVSLGIRSIVSDIPVNLELEEAEVVTFFRATSAEDLCVKMCEILNKPFSKISRNKLIEKNNARLKKLSEKLFDAIDFVRKRWPQC